MLADQTQRKVAGALVGEQVIEAHGSQIEIDRWIGEFGEGRSVILQEIGPPIVQKIVGRSPSSARLCARDEDKFLVKQVFDCETRWCRGPVHDGEV